MTTENKRVFAHSDAEQIEITIKITKPSVKLMEPVKPGLIEKIISALPPDWLLSAAESIGSILNPNSEEEPKEPQLYAMKVIWKHCDTTVDGIINLENKISDIIMNGMSVLNLTDRYQIFIHIDDAKIELNTFLDKMTFADMVLIKEVLLTKESIVIIEFI